MEVKAQCFGDGILMFCDALFLGLLAVIKMWRMNHFLTGLSMIPMAFLMAAGTTLGKYLMKKWEERQAAFSELSDFAQENYSGLAVIKAFVKETKELMMFRKLNRENEDINVEYTKISTLLNIMVTLFVESVICVILGYGGYLVYCGSFDAGQLVEYIGYFSAVVWPIMAVSMLIEKTSRGKASLNRITELLDAKVDVQDRGGVQDLLSIHGKIEFRNLTFRYPDGEYDVLKNVSFAAGPGEIVVLVGTSGAGKTTLVRVLLGLVYPESGRAVLRGKNGCEIVISAETRCAFSYVPQGSTLFSGTIAENLRMAKENATEEEMTAALKTACAWAFVSSLPNGVNTKITEHGGGLSEGQAQRIAIARALLRDCPVLLLDEATSALDPDTERQLLGNILSDKKRTVIFITHRLAVKDFCDQTLTIEKA